MDLMLADLLPAVVLVAVVGGSVLVPMAIITFMAAPAVLADDNREDWQKQRWNS